MAGPPPNPRLGTGTAKAPDSNMPNKNYEGGPLRKDERKENQRVKSSREDMRRKASQRVIEKARKTYGKTGGTEAPNTETHVYGRYRPE